MPSSEHAHAREEEAFPQEGVQRKIKKGRGLTSATAGHQRRGKGSREMAARVENIVSPESPSRD
jgi:hypothetical protein